MADQAVGELIRATGIGPTDLFVLEQSGVAKSLAGQVLLNWLTAAADGHGGINKIEKLKTAGLVDTYRITLADTTTFDFTVNNGKSITGISKTGTQGLVDTYTISYNDGLSTTFKVTNGAKGDKGDNAYTWVKYASQKPTESSHSIGDVPDNWIGIYSGNKASAPSNWQEYQWFQWKGEKGDIGDPARIISQEVKYQVGDSGSIIPSGNWQSAIPVTPQGKYLWTRTTLTFNSGSPVVSYTVSHQGLDGAGSVSSVAGVSPDPQGNVTLTADDVGALPTAGGEMSGPINMNGHSLTGLYDPEGGTDAARKGYVDKTVANAVHRDFIINGNFSRTINQRGNTLYQQDNGYTIDMWKTWWSGEDCELRVMPDRITLYRPVHACYLFQHFENADEMIGKPYTLAAMVKGSGSIGWIDSTQRTAYGSERHYSDWTLITATFTPVNNISDVGGKAGVEIATAKNEKFEVAWISMFAGIYTAETVPKPQPRGYAEELMECRRYYWRIASYRNITITQAIAYNATSLYGTLPFSMRVEKPTVNFSNLVFAATGISSAPKINTIQVRESKSNLTGLIMVASETNPGGVYNIWTSTTGGYLELSAEL